MILPPTAENIQFAARALAEGHLIGLPTETVYGIAANAFSVEAIHRVFTLKGRPTENPLIVHLAYASELSSVASSIPSEARELSAAFWPGPLTLVLPKQRDVPDEVTAGLPTVAVRVPSHPVARAVIETAGVPIAAPSANRFMALSPTRAADISLDIVSGLALVLDGGPCEIGIESTVLDLSGVQPRLLRPGGISRAAIEAIIGDITDSEGGHSSPGMYPRHYAPRAQVVLVESSSSDSAALVFGKPKNKRQIQMPTDAAEYAAKLYLALNELDRLGIDRIEVEAPPKAWEAVWDRIKKASTAET